MIQQYHLYVCTKKKKFKHGLNEISVHSHLQQHHDKPRERRKPNVPTMDRWIRKIWYRHTMGYYSALKRKEILLHAFTKMDLEDIILNEISQSQKNKYYMILPM